MKRTFKHQRRYHSLNQNKFHIRNAYSLLSKYIKIKLYRTLILPLVLYGCETWSLTLNEERRLRVYENRVLRRISGPKRDEVTGEWWNLHHEELNDLYSSTDIVRVMKSRRMSWAGHVARIGESRCIYRVLVGKPEGKRTLRRPRLRWDNNIKIDLQELGYEGMAWIDVAQDKDRWRAVVNAVMNLRVPQNAGNLSSSSESVSFSRGLCSIE